MRKRISILLITGVCLLALGCGKQDVFGGKYSRLPGDQIVFGVGSGEQSTRTEYRAGTYGNGEIQPIDWVAGDQIRVYSPDATRASWNQPEHWADYKVTPIASDASRGTLTNVQQIGLAWADAGNHTFYSIYPAPAGTDDALINDGIAGIFSVSIPATQTPGTQMAYASMAAAATADNRKVNGDAVTLEFYPAFTAFEFEIRCVEDGIVLDEIGIETSSAVTNPLSGEEKVKVALSGGIPTVNTIVTAGDKVTLSLDNVVLSSTVPVKLRILTLPNDAKDIKLWATRTLEGVTVKNKLALKRSTGEFLTFTGGRYHRITGIVTPSTFEIITVNGEDIDWDLQAYGETLIWD